MGVWHPAASLLSWVNYALLKGIDQAPSGGKDHARRTPVVTVVIASCGVHEAPQLQSWLGPSTLHGKPALALIPYLGDATNPCPFLPTPAGQMSPYTQSTVFEGYRTPAANTVGNTWVSPAGEQQIPQETCPVCQVSSET